MQQVKQSPPPTVDNQLISTAAKKARTKWLEKYLLQHLTELEYEDADYDDWFDSLIQLFESRGITEPDKQKSYLSDTRNAIRVLDPEHPALKVVDFDKQTWIDINNQSSDRIAERTTKFIDNPDAIVKRATKLLKSYQWSEIAAGLAVVTGRRSTEVIKTAQFEYKSKYSVIFTGALKRRGEAVECVFEIPTLCEAQLVIEAIASMRNKLGKKIQSLTKGEVRSRYGKSVSRKCDQYFTELVPPREGKDNLYTHLFRAVYGTIASYWYCPPTIPEMEFRAAIQGHYQILDEKNPELRRSIASERHYFDYKITDGKGNIEGNLGIKLNMPDVQIIEQFSHASKEIAPVSKLSQGKSNHPSAKPKQKVMTEQLDIPIPVPSFYLPRLEMISSKLGITPEEAIQALFTWTEMGLSLADSLDVDELTPQGVFDSVMQLKSSVEHLKSDAQSSLLASNVDEDSGNVFDKESIQKLCTSVELMANALYVYAQQQNAGQNGTAKVSPPVEDTFTKSPHEKVAARQDKAEERVNQCIDIIMEHNDDESVPYENKCYIGNAALRKLTKNGYAVIKRVIEARKEEIDTHHSLHELNNRHNIRGQNPFPIHSLISFPPDDED